MPYLDAVIREVLRLWSPAPNTIRVAKEKVVIPLGTAIEGRDGQLIESVTLNRGTQLFIRTSCYYHDTAHATLIKTSHPGREPVPLDLGR